MSEPNTTINNQRTRQSTISWWCSHRTGTAM